MLRTTYEELSGNFSADRPLIQKLWQEIELNYTGTGRFYHSLAHLENLLNELHPVISSLDNKTAVLFALYYHDIVYDAASKTNEEESADKGRGRMIELCVPLEIIDLTVDIILATKAHNHSESEDVNYFNDADLGILGQSPEMYMKYARDVRKEYSIYPDELYNPGRTAVLRSFLEMEAIFKTAYFNEKYDEQARRNIQSEIDMLKR